MLEKRPWPSGAIEDQIQKTVGLFGSENDLFRRRKLMVEPGGGKGTACRSPEEAYGQAGRTRHCCAEVTARVRYVG